MGMSKTWDFRQQLYAMLREMKSIDVLTCDPASMSTEQQKIHLSLGPHMNCVWPWDDAVLSLPMVGTIMGSFGLFFLMMDKYPD